MRAWIVALLFASLVRGADDEDRVRRLVERLRADAYAERQTALARLAAYGERIVPLLDAIDAPDPDVRRLLRDLTRAARRMRLYLVTAKKTLPIGAPVVLHLRLHNRTEDTYLVPLTTPSLRWKGLRSTVVLRVNGERVALPPERVEMPGAHNWPMKALDRRLRADRSTAPLVRPGQVIHLVVRLEEDDSPLRRPGRIEISARLENAGKRWPGVRVEPEGPGYPAAIAVEAEPLALTAVGRTPQALEAALRSGVREGRESALRELRVREDEAVLPVLRRNADDAELRLAAVRRLGAAGDERDFRLVYDATRDRNAAVRRAAVLGLSNFDRRRARSRLIALAQDHELKKEAIRALRGHRHVSTLDCYVRLLALGHEEGPVVKMMLDTIYDWTDHLVQPRRSEIRKFEALWVKGLRAEFRKRTDR